LSTLALDGSSTVPSRGHAGTALRYLDLGLLALALPAFIVAGWPLLGYVVAAGAWLLQRGIHELATRKVRRSIAGGDRRAALGIMGVSTLGRVWLLAIAVLIVGLVEREAGLAAALLTVALFTLYLGARVFERLLYPEEDEAG
jgi:putative exporter of polyketide antibiotics